LPSQKYWKKQTVNLLPEFALPEPKVICSHTLPSANARMPSVQNSLLSALVRYEIMPVEDSDKMLTRSRMILRSRLTDICGLQIELSK
jgi:hypothetical protein